MAKAKKIATASSSLFPPADFIHRALVHGLGVLGLLITLCFFTATYDSAHVKLTLLQMGGTVLLALWAEACIARRKNPFTRARLPFLLPVFIYIGWNILCYALAPYHAEAAEEFFRFLLYGGLTLLAATELTVQDVKTLTKYLIVAAWISFAYATLQIFKRWWPAIDPVDWRGLFTTRVFSTHANPNFFADFAVFSSCIIAAAYALTRKKSLLVLLTLAPVCLFFSESKGAWLAYAFCAALAAVVYTNTLAGTVQKHLKKINLTVLALLLASVLAAGYYTSQRMQSVNFRTHTWLGVVEMIKDRPVFGVGVGNFKVIYSAYRHPQIFYIESAPNVETQHAENELLEQAAVAGLPGLAVFLWMLFFIFYLAWRRLKETGTVPASRERNLYLWGYGVALAGMFVHSWVDISIHFASSGFFFALFAGVVLALCFSPEANSFIPARAAAAEKENTSPVVRLLQLTLALAWLTLIIVLCAQFYEVMSPVAIRSVTEFVLAAAAWLVLVGALLGAAFISIAAALKFKRPSALLVLCAAVPLLYGAFSLFRANHYYSLAVNFSQTQNYDGALLYFTKAVRANPLQAEYRQFRANVLALTLDLTRTFAPNRGDKKSPSNDFERALRDLDTAQKMSPNHPLLHHNRGQLYYVLALTQNNRATHAKSQAEYDPLAQSARENMALAKAAFKRALLADPTNEQTYAYLIQIALLENDLVRAQIEVALGNNLRWRQSEIRPLGHAMEIRVNAENPDRGFMPCPGTVKFYQPPGGPGVRVDSHLYDGYVIPPYYDSLLAKIIVHDETRELTRQKAMEALRELAIEGVPTTAHFSRELLASPEFASGEYHTGTLEELLRRRNLPAEVNP